MIFSILKLLALAVWLGALIMLGAAVAAPIFQQLPSKTLAGQLNGVILGRMNTMEWVCAAISLIASVALLMMAWDSPEKTWRLVDVVVAVIMMLLLWYYSDNITGRMNELRATIKDFDHPQTTTEYVQAKSEFDDLHHRYTKLVSANMLLILGDFVLASVLLRR